MNKINKVTSLVFWFLIAFHISPSLGQVDGIATYNIKSIISFSNNQDQDVNKALSIIENQSKNTEGIKLVLYFNKKESLFFLEESMEVDDGNKFNMALLFAKRIGKIYNHYKTQELLQEKELLDGTKVIVKKDTKGYSKWKLRNEKKKIGGYNCYRASMIKQEKRNSGKLIDVIVEAWYAPEILSNSGPYGYNGLPGLIIELKEGEKFIYTLKEVSFKKNDKKITKPKKGKLISEEEYKKISSEISKKIRAGLH